MNQNSNILYVAENYNKHFNEKNKFLYISKFIELIHQYLVHATEHVFVQDIAYHKFIIQRGIQAMKHIYNNLLLYTKNLDLTYHHVQKAYCYYIEFIGQISDEHHSFLQLSSKDAVLFIYKKTIFDVNQEYRKTSSLNEDETDLLSNINSITNNYNDYLTHIISNNDKMIKDGNNSKLIMFIIKHSKDISETIFETSETMDECKQKFKLIERCCYHLYNKGVCNLKVAIIIQTLIKKNNTKNISHEHIINRASSDKFEIIQEASPLRIANWLLS